jgi:hypothetical protein
MVASTAYVTKHATPANKVTYTLPATAALGDTFKVQGYTSGGWRIAQNANQQIFFGDKATTIGAGGYLEFTNQYDSVELVCVTANLEFAVLEAVGNITYA